jgi:osmotically-inducible protein OsmY
VKQGHDRHGVETAGRERLDWDPSLDASDIGVSLDEGVVTLRGNVASYAEKMAAERFALRVLGVTQVEDRLT